MSESVGLTLDEQIGIAVGQMGMSLETFLGLTLSQWQEAYDAFIIKEKSERDFRVRLVQQFDESIWRLGRRMVWKWLFPGKAKQAAEADMWPMPGDKEKTQAEKNKQPKSTRKRFEKLAEKWRS